MDNSGSVEIRNVSNAVRQVRRDEIMLRSVKPTGQSIVNTTVPTMFAAGGKRCGDAAAGSFETVRDFIVVVVRITIAINVVFLV